MNRTVSFACGLLSVWIIGYLMIVGRGLLIPFIIAIFIWNLLNTLNSALQSLPLVGPRIPQPLSMVVSLLIVALFIWVLVTIVTSNVNEVIAASSRYQYNLTKIMGTIDEQFRIKLLSNFNQFFRSLSPQQILINVTSVFTSITSSAVLISLYVFFLFVEQLYFQQKINAIFHQKGHRELVQTIISHIVQDTQTYLGLKTLMSLLTAFTSYLIMRWVGLDFAEFWAMLIFFLNFIPNIGAIIATGFPALLAVIQFQSWGPFIIITTCLFLIQFIIGNLIEPRFMGRSLNLSPLVILISLSVWGAIWGVMGMFLSIPITVMMMIIFANFTTTKPIAILLSQDGDIRSLSERIAPEGNDS